MRSTSGSGDELLVRRCQTNEAVARGVAATLHDALGIWNPDAIEKQRAAWLRPTNRRRAASFKHISTDSVLAQIFRPAAAKLAKNWRTRQDSNL